MRRLVTLLAAWVVLLYSGTARPEPVIIEGGPPIGGHVDRCSQQVGCLWCALQVLGCPVSYENLLVASGAAFRIGWLPGQYHWGSVDVTPEDHVRTAAEAVGATIEWRAHASEADAWKTIRQSIDDGRPVLIWRGHGAHVVLGYDEPTEMLHVRNYTTPADRYDEIAFEVTKAAEPQQRPDHEVCLIWYDAKQAPPELDWPLILDRAITYADWPEENRLCKSFVFGLAAYDAWAATFRQGIDKWGAENDVNLTLYMGGMLADARTSASKALDENGTLHEAFGIASGHYKAEAEILKGLPHVLAGGTISDWQAAPMAYQTSFPKPAIREQAAALVERAKAEEVQAVDALRLALADLHAH